MVMQAIVVRFVTKEGPIATAAALLGLKPILDGVNIVFDVPARPGAFHSEAAFGYTRACETSTESIPFVVMQALALMEHQSIAQWLSFGISVSNIAHAVASVDYSFDTSLRFRNIEPLCYGCYLPGAKGDGLFASIAVFAFGYVTAKLVAVATLGTTSPASLMLFMVSESIALLLVRFAIVNWRWYSAAGDSAVVSLTVHFLLVYPCMIAAPFPFLRHPFFISPSLYSGFIAWSLFAANPLMLALSFRYHDPATSQWIVWAILGSATALSVVAAVVAVALMQPTFRGTFYRHRTMVKHMRGSLGA